MKKALSLVLALVMVAALVLTGCSKPAEQAPAGDTQQAPKPEAKKMKVGFIYVGPVGDGGWSFSHDQGRKQLEKELGVETVYQESVPEGPEVEKVVNDMVDQGCTVIFGTSFGFMDYMEKAAKNHPDVKFLHCSGYKTAENMGNYFGKMYQARYLSGIVAGLKTKTNKIGYVAAFEIPEVINGINSFTLGVQSVNKDAVVKVRWTHTWYDPAKEKEAAKALLDEGVDVMSQHQDTAGPLQAAEEKGAFAIGYNSDTSALVPKAFMTAPVWNWGPYYIETVKAVQNGTWKAEAYYTGMDTGIVDLVPLTANAPEGAQAAVDKAKAEILAGKQIVFAGPIKDQTGAEKVPAGSALSEDDILKMNWFVQGVDGKIETK